MRALWRAIEHDSTHLPLLLCSLSASPRCLCDAALVVLHHYVPTRLLCRSRQFPHREDRKFVVEHRRCSKTSWLYFCLQSQSEFAPLHWEHTCARGLAPRAMPLKTSQICVWKGGSICWQQFLRAKLGLHLPAQAKIESFSVSNQR